MWALDVERALRGYLRHNVVLAKSFNQVKILSETDGEAHQTGIELKSLILAQIERWRNALHMQVERALGLAPRLVANG